MPGADPEGITDDFLRKGLQLTVDGLEPQAIRNHEQISSQEERHARAPRSAVF